MQLFIGNKNYSSWSMRPWVLMTQAGIPFEEVRVRFDSFDAGSAFKKAMEGVSPVGKVPVLLLDDSEGGWAVWDSLAIAETLAERHPEHRLWPADRLARARARSVCAEMHSGFGALRTHLGMNIEAVLPEVGARVLREQPDVKADVDRIVHLWREALQTHRGPMLFGEFTVADAFFAPIVMRFQTYGVPVPPDIADYMARVRALRGVAAWVEQALAERDFLSFEEPYRNAL